MLEHVVDFPAPPDDRILLRIDHHRLNQARGRGIAHRLHDRHTFILHHFIGGMFGYLLKSERLPPIGHRLPDRSTRKLPHFDYRRRFRKKWLRGNQQHRQQEQARRNQHHTTSLMQGGRGSPSTARIERPPLYRARSASTEGDHARPHPLLIHANNFISRAFLRGVKCALRQRFTTFLFTSACVG